MTAANGVTEKITALPRAVLLPESVQHAAATWTAVTRPTNLLLVFDTSGSMGGEVSGTGKTRLDLTKAAALGALDLFDDSAQVGVWAFSTVSNGKDYRQLLPLGPLRQEPRPTSRSRSTACSRAATPASTTRPAAACQYVATNFVAGATNLVVLLTDGADDNNVSGGLTLDALLTNLTTNLRRPRPEAGQGDHRRPRHAAPTPRSCADLGRHQGPDFSSPNTFDVSQVVLSALFS